KIMSGWCNVMAWFIAEKSLISPRISIIPSATLATVKRLIFVGGCKAKPTTLACNCLSHNASQLPLKPVWPVIRTFLFFQKVTKSSTVLYPLSKVLLKKFYRARYPLAAKNLRVNVLTIVLRWLIALKAHAPRSLNHLGYNLRLSAIIQKSRH